MIENELWGKRSANPDIYASLELPLTSVRRLEDERQKELFFVAIKGAFFEIFS
jgi:hypothetical protein